MLAIANVLLALLAASAVNAAPPSKRQTALTTCDFVLAPDASVAGIDFETEFNYVIGRSLAIKVSGTHTHGAGYTTITDNADGTFTIEKSLGVEGKTASQTAAILTGLTGTTTNGFENNAGINWTFDSVTCDA